ncbi:hypothetical protein ACH5RR_009013 [Cinchona calisaya]|uniref:Uncharacterized protein n=1 Tax=Cinchona calisaya TaxID=153742 RepID=A0ABD3AFG1_9GENT
MELGSNPTTTIFHPFQILSKNLKVAFSCTSPFFFCFFFFFRKFSFFFNSIPLPFPFASPFCSLPPYPPSTFLSFPPTLLPSPSHPVATNFFPLPNLFSLFLPMNLFFSFFFFLDV